MFHLADNAELRGIGYKLLVVLQACNIIALLLVAAASWVMVVMTGITSHFFFFDAAAHVFGSSIALFLVLSELQRIRFLRRYFESTWPVFSDRHGLFWLGAAMLMLGCDLLGNLNKDAFSAQNLGLPLWRLVLAAGILVFVFGVANCIATVVFRDAAGLNARMIRSDGNLADCGKLGPGVASGGYYDSGSGSYNKEIDDSADDDVPSIAPGYHGRFKRATQIFRKNPLTQAVLARHSNSNNRPTISMPIGMPIPVGGEAANTTLPRGGGGGGDSDDDDIERATTAADGRSTYSAGTRASPILPDVRRPPTALHPAMAKRSASGRYSVANMSRF